MPDGGQSLAIDAVAELLERLAVLLTAGLTPASAWRFLADDARDADPSRLRDERVLRMIVREVDSGYRAGAAADVTLLALRPGLAGAAAVAWPPVAAVWRLATRAGAPLGAALADLADELRDVAQQRREIETGLASVRASTRLVLALPVLGVGLSGVAGVDTLGVLFGTVPGSAALAVAVLLLVAARTWTGRLIRRASNGPVCGGLVLQLTLLGLSGGWSIERCRREVVEVVRQCGLHATVDVGAADRSLVLAARAGAPIAPLLRAELARTRRVATARSRSRIASLSVRALVPLGVCVLPAFLLSSVLPMVIGLLRASAAGLS